MENTSKNNYAKTCVLNVTADVKDGKNYVSDVYFTSPFKVMKPFHLNKNYDCYDANCFCWYLKRRYSRT